ncbi:hypothetical protein BJ875DRAFT_521898 [Amylocarpus encephaloides]|uniref:Uncharacterized protein n=1 Tax=Amylocarpus encephaloides TaxID=45428 RepID=A0A9P7YAP5_9HELO|nr:hypothetical protein BJ875DRAFT_521898 [Amylocarpus encephaloides]
MENGESSGSRSGLSQTNSLLDSSNLANRVVWNASSDNMLLMITRAESKKDFWIIVANILTVKMQTFSTNKLNTNGIVPSYTREEVYNRFFHLQELSQSLVNPDPDGSFTQDQQRLANNRQAPEAIVLGQEQEHGKNADRGGPQKKCVFEAKEVDITSIKLPELLPGELWERDCQAEREVAELERQAKEEKFEAEERRLYREHSARNQWGNEHWKPLREAWERQQAAENPPSPESD